MTETGKLSKVDASKSQCSQTDLRNAQQSPAKHNPIRKPSGTGSKILRKGSTTVTSEDRNDTISVRVNPKSSQRNVPINKNQSCQTIDPKKFNQLFHDGVIKYPSNRIMQELAEIEKQKAKRLDAHVKKEFFKRNKLKHKTSPVIPLRPSVKDLGKGDMPENNSDDNNNKSSVNVNEDNVENEPPADSQPTEPELVPEKNQASINAADIIRKTTEDHLQYSPRGALTQRSSGGYPSNRSLNHGDASAKASKKSITKKTKEEDAALKMVMDPMCPPGHIPLPDQERKKTLHMLRVSYAELVREMNLLPVRTDTLRVRQKKIQLENQLSKIEEGIKVFSKSKVYVKIEE